MIGNQHAARGISSWLRLAATPTFAIMAVVTCVSGSRLAMLCSAPHASPLDGMVPMYALMSLFHAAPWVERAAAILGGAAPASRAEHRC